MDLKSTQYIEKQEVSQRHSCFFFFSFYQAYIICLSLPSLENEEVEVSDMVLPSKTSGDVEYIEQDDLSANCKFLIDRTTHWLG